MLSVLRSFGKVRLYQHANFVARYKATQEAKSALIILAPGAEEMEFTISADVLRRGKVSLLVYQPVNQRNCLKWINS